MKNNRLKDLREDKDLYQRDIAEILKITQTQYSRYETGYRTMPIQLIIKLAKYYNVDLNYIVGISNIKKPYPER